MNFLQPSLHLFLESDLRQTALNVVRFERVSTYTSERMVHEEIHIPNQGHTLACMIRDLLFEHGSIARLDIVKTLESAPGPFHPDPAGRADQKLILLEIPELEGFSP